jgi:ABC-type cobalt transport system substrate-binding protein
MKISLIDKIIVMLSPIIQKIIFVLNKIMNSYDDKVVKYYIQEIKNEYGYDCEVIYNPDGGDPELIIFCLINYGSDWENQFITFEPIVSEINKKMINNCFDFNLYRIK